MYPNKDIFQSNYLLFLALLPNPLPSIPPATHPLHYHPWRSASGHQPFAVPIIIRSGGPRIAAPVSRSAAIAVATAWRIVVILPISTPDLTA